MRHTNLEDVDSYYQASRKYTIEVEQLQGAHKADVVVIGGGITGVSAALQLAVRGVDVMLLEAHDFGWGASGRSGGQILSGYSISQNEIERLVGVDTAHELWQHSLAALAWTRHCIEQYRIDCDLTNGCLYVGVKPKQARELNDWAAYLGQHYNHSETQYLDRSELQAVLASTRYHGGVFEPSSGHLHPLNYCLGLTAAAQRSGARLYKHCPVQGVHSNNTKVTVNTQFGSIACDQVIYACNAYLDRLQPNLAKWIMPVSTYIIATEPLSEEIAVGLIANRAAVADTNLVLDYYRLSADNRMLFGGLVSYSNVELFDPTRSLRRRMLKVFPQLTDTAIDFSWGGCVAVTRRRLPHIGLLAPSSWFAQGFSGHGMALSGYTGKLLAEAVLGNVKDIECFQKISHKAFIGSATFRMPLLVAEMAYKRVLEKLR